MRPSPSTQGRRLPCLSYCPLGAGRARQSEGEGQGGERGEQVKGEEERTFAFVGLVFSPEISFYGFETNAFGIK